MSLHPLRESEGPPRVDVAHHPTGIHDVSSGLADELFDMFLRGDMKI